MHRAAATTLTVAALAASLSAQTAISLKAGLLNYAEGQLGTTMQGVEHPRVSAFRLPCGEELQTTRGRAELLLEPAIFLRLDNGTRVAMDSDTLGDVAVHLFAGSVIVDAVDVPKGSHTRITVGAHTYEIHHVGIYRFDADTGRVAVYDGKLEFTDAAKVTLKKGHYWDLASAHNTEFDEKQVDRFQRWSARRAVAVAQSNLVSARSSIGYGWRRATRSWQFSLQANWSAARAKLQIAPAGF